MTAYAELIKAGIALVLAIIVALTARGCGKDAGLREGERDRGRLESALAAANLDVSSCASAVGLANTIADQAADESLRLQRLADQAAARAEQSDAHARARIADLTRQLQEARRNPDAAAQLDMVLHPSIPLR